MNLEECAEILWFMGLCPFFMDLCPFFPDLSSMKRRIISTKTMQLHNPLQLSKSIQEQDKKKTKNAIMQMLQEKEGKGDWERGQGRKEGKGGEGRGGGEGKGRERKEREMEQTREECIFLGTADITVEIGQTILPLLCQQSHNVNRSMKF